MSLTATSLAEADRSLIARDRALPGLGLVLEPDALLSELRAAWPGRDLQDLKLTYLRYKPGTNCLAAYALCIDGRRQFVHITAHLGSEPDKPRKALEKFRGESPHEPLLLPGNLVVRAFPTDRKLDALARLALPGARRKVLQKILPAQPELWDAELRILRYKPERRLVAQLCAPDGRCALLKLYQAADFERARAGAYAFGRGALLSAPLLGVSERYRVLVWQWLGAASGDTLITSPDAAFSTGRALAALHAQPTAELLPVHRADEARPLQAAADQVAYLLPELAARVQRLAATLSCQLQTAPTLSVPVHGDFSADQVLHTPAGAAIIDFDAAALGDPAWDFGTFRAQLERTVLRGELTAEAAASVYAALESGYTGAGASLPPRSVLYTAAGLLRLAPHAFRTRKPVWPEETAALIARAEALSFGRCSYP